MPAEAADKRAREGNVPARRDIRRAEASRVLGVLDRAELPTSQIVSLSNGYTDELIGKLRGFVARVTHR
jgi:hypothetical protein